MKTAQLGESIGNDKAVALLAKIKEEIAKNPPQTDADMRALIERIAQELGITLTEDEINSLLSLFNKMKNVNIDWNQVNEQLAQTKDKLSAFYKQKKVERLFSASSTFYEKYGTPFAEHLGHKKITEVVASVIFLLLS